MNSFDRLKKILVDIVSNRSMMTIWIFGAAILLVLASPNVAHDGGAAKVNTPEIKNLATSPIAQRAMESLIRGNSDAGKKQLNENDKLSAGSTTGQKQSIQENSIIIDKIGANVPIVIATTTDAAKLHQFLDLGAVLYPTSVGIGKIGQTVILGHSAPVNWPNIKHDTAFSRINELIEGDTIQINYLDRTYKYRVTRSQIIPKGTDLTGETPGASWLVLVTCWPPGRDRERLAVEAMLLPE